MLYLAASVYAPKFPPLRDFFNFPSFPIPVLAFYSVLATWVQPSHPASPRPSSVSGANLVLTHRLLSFLPLSAAVRQFWCHGRWYERSDLCIQLAVHRRCHWLCRYDHRVTGVDGAFHCSYCLAVEIRDSILSPMRKVAFGRMASNRVWSPLPLWGGSTGRGENNCPLPPLMLQHNNKSIYITINGSLKQQ